MPSIKADRIGVSINDGAVMLSGQVETYPEKEAAVRAALRVRGVIAVANEIEVKHSWGPREDADIAREATVALEHTVLVPADAAKASVQDHVVTLSGQVAWQYQRDAIRHAVSALPGVTGVRNTITLTPEVAMVSPAEAKTKITAALVRNAQLDAKHIHVAVTGSDVKLTGSVSSWAEHRQAANAAWATPGVTHVANGLRVHY